MTDQGVWERGRGLTDLGKVIRCGCLGSFLYGSDTWMILPLIGRDLGGLQHRVSYRLTGQKPQRWIDGRLRYPPLEEAIEEARLHEM